MVSYDITDLNGNCVSEGVFDEFIEKIWKDYSKSYFKSDGLKENRMYMLKDKDKHICRIDMGFGYNRTSISLSDFEKKGIEKKLISDSSFIWKEE